MNTLVSTVELVRTVLKTGVKIIRTGLSLGRRNPENLQSGKAEDRQTFDWQGKQSRVLQAAVVPVS